MKHTFTYNHQSQFIEMFGNPINNTKNWKISSLKDACVLVSDGPFGSNLKSCHYVQEGVRVIRLQNICQGQFNDTDRAYISNEHYKTLKRYTCNPGEIVIATLGEPNLRACIIPDYIKLSINKADCIHVIPKSDLLNPVFVCSYFNSTQVLHLATSDIHGTTRARIAGGQVANFPVFLPPIKLQEEFAAIVRQADKSKFDGFKSQFIEMFGDFDKSEWPNMTFTEFAKIDAQMTSDFDSYSEYPHIGIESIQQNTGHILNYKTVKEDAVKSGKYVFTSKHIIYSKIRPNLNKVATPDFDGLCSADAYPILPKFKVVRKEFLAFILRSSIFLDYIIPFSRRTGMPKVNREQVEGFQLHMPPLPLQDEFLTISNQADKSKYYVQNKQNYICHILTNQIQLRRCS